MIHNIFKARIESDPTCFGGMQNICCVLIHPITGETITKYKKIAEDGVTQKVWTRVMSKKPGQLSQGFINEKGTDTVKFITPDQIHNIPKDRTVPYAYTITYYRPQIAYPNRVRITTRGNIIDYPFKLTTQTAYIVTTKIIWSSVLSIPGTKYMCIDIKNMYLATTMDRFEYMIIPMKLIPEEFAKL